MVAVEKLGKVKGVVVWSVVESGTGVLLLLDHTDACDGPHRLFSLSLGRRMDANLSVNDGVGVAVNTAPSVLVSTFITRYFSSASSSSSATTIGCDDEEEDEDAVDTDGPVDVGSVVVVVMGAGGNPFK